MARLLAFAGHCRLSLRSGSLTTAELFYWDLIAEGCTREGSLNGRTIKTLIGSLVQYLIVNWQTKERLACSRLQDSSTGRGLGREIFPTTAPFQIARVLSSTWPFDFAMSLLPESLAQASEGSEIYQTQGSHPYEGNASDLAMFLPTCEICLYHFHRNK